MLCLLCTVVVCEVKADKCYEYLRKFWDRFGTDRDCLQAAATYVALYKLAVKNILPGYS